MRDGLREVVAKKPTIGDVRFNFLDRLAHGANPEQILNEYDFDENNGVKAGKPRL
jgi:hypothetical protein